MCQIYENLEPVKLSVFNKYYAFKSKYSKKILKVQRVI